MTPSPFQWKIQKGLLQEIGQIEQPSFSKIDLAVLKQTFHSSKNVYLRNLALSPYMGEELPSQIKETEIQRDLFNDQSPEVISNGQSVDTEARPGWLELARSVPVEEWKEVRADSHNGCGDSGSRNYRCHLDGQMVQVTDNQKRILSWLQRAENYCLDTTQHQDAYAEIKLVDDMLKLSRADVEELQNLLAMYIEYRRDLKARRRSCYNTVGQPLPPEMDSDSDSVVNSCLLNPSGDIPHTYETPLSNMDHKRNGVPVKDSEGEEEEESETSDDGPCPYGQVSLVNPLTGPTSSRTRPRPSCSRVRTWTMDLNDSIDHSREPEAKRVRVATRDRNFQARSNPDIPHSTKDGFIELNKDEEQTAYKFLKMRQRESVNWTDVEGEYAKRFQISRSHQWLRSYIKAIDDFSEAHPKIRELGPLWPHKAYLAHKEQKQM